MTCKKRGRVAKLTRAMHYINNPEFSSPEETRCQFNGGKADIKLGIDVHQDFYVVVEQVGGSDPKPAQRFGKEAFLHWAAKLKSQTGQVHAVYKACALMCLYFPTRSGWHSRLPPELDDLGSQFNPHP